MARKNRKKKENKQKPKEPVTREEIQEQLLRTLDSLGSSIEFCVSGRRNVMLPGLSVEGVGKLSFPIQPEDAEQLIEVASQAPYGRGEDTIVDTEVRDVWEIEPSQLSFRKKKWTSFVEDIVIEVGVRLGLSLRKKIQFELYKMLVYEEGSFFVPHKDTEKVDGMFATLVISLPSFYEGGQLHISHDGETEVFDFGGEEGEESIFFGAFYTDCEHEVKPVTNGYRVVLVYNLSVPRTKKQPHAPDSLEQAERVASLLQALFSIPGQDPKTGGCLEKIMLPCKHSYTQAGLHPYDLKGADFARFTVLSRAAKPRSASPLFGIDDLLSVWFHRRKFSGL